MLKLHLIDSLSICCTAKYSENRTDGAYALVYRVDRRRLYKHLVDLSDPS